MIIILNSLKEEKKRQANTIGLTQENISNTINKEITEATKPTEESNYMDKKDKRSKTLDIKIKENDLSFISNMSENEKKYEKKNKFDGKRYF